MASRDGRARLVPISRESDMRLAVVLVAGALAAACATPAPGDASAAGADSGKVCKRITPTDSNMPQRICRTKEEWAALDREGQKGVEEFERARDEAASVGQ